MTAICSEVLWNQGKPYPRTCAVHGLWTPCSEVKAMIKFYTLIEKSRVTGEETILYEQTTYNVVEKFTQAYVNDHYDVIVRFHSSVEDRSDN